MVIRDFPLHPPSFSSPSGCHSNSAAAGNSHHGAITLPFPPPPMVAMATPTNYKNWAAISRAQLLQPCSLGTVNLAQERTLHKACFKPICFVICLQFGLPICVDLTFGAKTQEEVCLTRTGSRGPEPGPEALPPPQINAPALAWIKGELAFFFRKNAATILTSQAWWKLVSSLFTSSVTRCTATILPRLTPLDHLCQLTRVIFNQMMLQVHDYQPLSMGSNCTSQIYFPSSGVHP
ncbi:uncharacterized protein [Castor canadensis]|uniref:Uncharacterized protein n=1 Tax=Castor canadensis TaxID=51338 RepID=A0AC58LV88_CASCN